MQVSKILIMLILGLAVAALVASPVAALEHPWEEGEGGQDLPGDGLPSPDEDIPPCDDGTPLWSAVTGPTLFWWHIVWDYLTETEALNVQSVKSGSVTDIRLVPDSRPNMMETTLR